MVRGSYLVLYWGTGLLESVPFEAYMLLGYLLVGWSLSFFQSLSPS